MSIAEKLVSVAENVPKVYAAGQKSMVDESKIIEQTAIGTDILSIDDVSEVPHKLKVSLASKNLIDFSRPNNELTLSLCTLGEDGKTLVSNFTEDYYSQIVIYYLNDLLLNSKGKTFTFSIKESYDDVSLAVVIYGDRTSGATYQGESTGNSASSVTFTIAEDFTSISKIELRFNRKGLAFTEEGREFTEFQLEKGSKATKYAGNIADFSNVTVSQYGKNIIPYPFTKGTATIGGVTFTDNGDGTITVNGTATGGNTVYEFAKIDLKGGTTYTLSGCPAGGDQHTFSLFKSRTDYSDYQFDSGTGCTFTPSADATYIIGIQLKNGTTVSNLVYKPQLEYGFSTEYEPYNVKTLTANADGTIDSAKSISPKMTLVADADGIEIAATYHKSYGMQVENQRFWDMVTIGRTEYTYAFKLWNTGGKNLRPPKKIVFPAGMGIIQLFYRCKGITKIEADYFDFSKIGNLITYDYVFANCPDLEEIEDVGLYCGKLMQNTFANSTKLKKIANIGVEEGTTFSATFNNCTALEEVRFTGTIGNSLTISQSPLSHDSLMSIINALKDFSGTTTTKTLTLGTANLAKLTDAEKAKATQKGWTLA